MSGELEFSFEELPIIVDLGFEAGLVNGSATIGYHRDGEWAVREIALDGYRAEKNTDVPDTHIVLERKPVVIDRAERAWLYLSILDQLENGRFRSSIDEAVAKELGEAGVSLPDPDREHSTLNRAHSGV